MTDKDVTILTIDDYMLRHGTKTPVSLVIWTRNRFKVLECISNKKPFTWGDISFLQFLDELKKEGVIESYKTDVMRLSYEAVWK
jgi:hypothetical protein